MSGTESTRETIKFDEVRWLPPAESIDNLPADASDGSLCYVQAEDAVYRQVNGIWVLGADKKG